MTLRFIRENECARITGLERSTRARLEKQGKFPKRHKITDTKMGWLESDIQEWIRHKVQGEGHDIP